MKFKIDENLPVEVAEFLRGKGHDAATVFDEQLQGAPDTTIAAACRNERRALITLDTDFGDIRAYPPEDYFGFIILQIRRLDKGSVIRILSHIAGLFEEQPVEHFTWIVEENRIRIRGSESGEANRGGGTEFRRLQ